MKQIDCFDGQYAFLSNFFATKVYYNGIIYLHSEGAFQAAKSLDEHVRKEFALMMKTPGQAKRAGKGRPFKASNGETLKIELRPDWEEVKDSIMYEIVRAKFTQNRELTEALLATENAELIEGNYWHDNYWGSCSCERCLSRTGRNQLGKTLMKVREELRKEKNLLGSSDFNNETLITNKKQLMDCFLDMVTPEKEHKLVITEEVPVLSIKAKYNKMPSLPAGALDGPLKPPCSKRI